MDFCSQIVRNVELPASLSDFSKLTKLKGGIILKDATAENGVLRVEGDLLWQGFSMVEHGEEKCTWEGAEYFSDSLDVPELRFRDPFMLEPQVVDLTAEASGEKECNLTFKVRWWEEERANAEEENFEAELEGINENFRETVEDFKLAGEEDDLNPDAVIESEPVVADIIEEPPAQRESKVTEICNDFRELRKKNNTSVKEEPIKENYSMEVSEELAPSSSDTGSYCLRFYRASENDSLESIADRFSVSLTKMRLINELDEVGSISGRLVRIPKV